MPSSVTTRPLSPTTNPLRQHPNEPYSTVSPPASPLTPPTQTLILGHPAARLSSSPASSPRIVDSPPIRTRSMRPEMDHDVFTGANFFDDTSVDEDPYTGSEWEDDEGTRTFSEVEGLGIHGSGWRLAGATGSGTRTVGGQNVLMNALPPFNQLPALESGTLTMDEGASLGPTDTRKARQMSLRRLGKGKVVHNHGSGSAGTSTPRDSLRSRGSDTISPFPVFRRQSPSANTDGVGDNSGIVGGGHHYTGHLRRNTSESICADSILNAHAVTMRALETLSPSASLSLARQRTRSYPSAKPKPLSFSKHRHVTLSQIDVADDPERPPNLPAHFIKTPYPFSAKKEFPKPRTRPRNDDTKGKHLLGIVPSQGEYDLRSRLERNEDAQGVIRSTSDTVGRKGISEKEEHGKRVLDRVLWLSLRSRGGKSGLDRLEKIILPSSLTTTRARSENSKRKGAVNEKHGHDTVDFDDHYFAMQLQHTYRKLAGSWLWRALSARRVKHIRLGQVSVWSGNLDVESGSSVSKLLMVGQGFDGDNEAATPFTEHNLMDLYRTPKSGKARYTWVHWARRVAASNDTTEAGSSTYKHRRAEPLRDTDDTPHNTNTNTNAGDPNSFTKHNNALDSTRPADAITTIQFVQSFSVFRIVSVLALMLCLSAFAALAWIFLGANTWDLGEERARAERVGGGMVIHACSNRD
ncbi:hypothetical protein BDV95DRAFT_233063 [Massariosphaeria phaeospora]|uniref:Uncharacterized protein n=1 Tax=Massariosphaeria phaeospora TaxID=100035 RepID=A0A7C8IGJ5_9PLEO|nr:hypothetical protein BDV95DRAFT_233063 [Massariosphaeria phaeospora]